jgi:hypothetical protein
VESICEVKSTTLIDLNTFVIFYHFIEISRLINCFISFIGMEADEKLYNKLVSGYRMEQPQYAPKRM